MKISTKSGHLTAIEKRHIKQILKLNLMAGKVNRKSYFLQKIENVYTVEIHERYTKYIGEDCKLHRHRVDTLAVKTA